MLAGGELLLNVVILFFLVIVAFGAVITRNLMTSTILLSIFSLLMSLQYLILAAPDVAMTEAAIGAGISTIITLTALILTGSSETSRYKYPLFALVLIFFTGAALLYATIGMPAFGDPNAPVQTYLAPHFITESEYEIGIPNIVTSILASYRGFDTLGEVVVIVTAALSVFLLLGRPAKKQTKE